MSDSGKLNTSMFFFDHRLSDSPLVDLVWRTHSDGGGTFMSTASSRLEMVITKQQGGIHFSIRGPETKASLAPIPEDAEFLGIQFKLGTFVSCLPAAQLVNGGVHLPGGAGKSFWLHGSAWQFPSFDNVDKFVERLVRQGILTREPLVEAALRGSVQDLTPRSIQRRFLRTMGVPPGKLFQIERALQALKLLQAGTPILDVVEQAGYYDQPHLTRSLRQLIGQTPAQILTLRSDE